MKLYTSVLKYLRFLLYSVSRRRIVQEYNGKRKTQTMLQQSTSIISMLTRHRREVCTQTKVLDVVGLLSLIESMREHIQV